MPELPEVEIVRRGLEKALLGQQLASVQINRRDLRVPIPQNFEEAITGRRVNNLQRRGKYIVIGFDAGPVSILHLGMSGRIYIHPPSSSGPAALKHDHAVVFTNTGVCVVFNDPRRFGMLYLSEQRQWLNEKPFSEMGPEPLSNGFNGPALRAALKNKKTSIKTALLDQRVVAGVGNIYACEALFDAAIHPERIACHLNESETELLSQAIKVVLEKAIKAGGSTLRDYKQTDGSLGYFQYQFSVYDREGEPCPGCVCNGAVKRMVQSGRSTFYCEEKQK